MKPAAIALLSVLSLLPVSIPAADLATAPSTRPAAAIPERVSALVGQLGADEFDTREKATEELTALGRAALPALKEALKHDDPEVKTRAQAIIARIEGRDRKAPAGNPDWRVAPGIGGAFNRSIRMQVTNGDKLVEVTEDGRSVRISENQDGITLSVTEQRDGKEVTEEFKAKDAAELKKNHPNAHALYERYAAGGGQVHVWVGGGGGQIILPPRIVKPGVMPPDAMRGMEQMRRELEEMLKEADLPAPAKEQIRKQIQDLNDARDRQPEPATRPSPPAQRQ